MNQLMKKVIVFGMSFCMLLVTTFAGNALAENADPMAYKGKVRIGAQSVNETIVLAWMAKLLIEKHTGLKTTINTEFAASNVLHEAMINDELDIYPSWTGTMLTGPLRYEGPNMSKTETFAMTKEGFEKNFNVTLAEPVGFNNTYILAVRRDVAEKYNLKKSSDLKDLAPKWILAGDENYDVRTDGYAGWTVHYGITFKKVLPMQYSLIYQAIAQSEVDVIAAYSTDSRIVKLDLVTLDDDKEFFPDYSGVFALPVKLTKKFPKLMDVVSMLSGKVDNYSMVTMNKLYDEGGDPEQIASDFLKSKGLI